MADCPHCTVMRHGQVIKVRSFKNPVCPHCGKRVYAVSIETEEGFCYNSMTREAKSAIIDVIKGLEGNLKRLKQHIN